MWKGILALEDHETTHEGHRTLPDSNVSGLEAASATCRDSLDGSMSEHPLRIRDSQCAGRHKSPTRAIMFIHIEHQTFAAMQVLTPAMPKLERDGAIQRR